MVKLYEILPHTKKQAKKLGVRVFPSEKKSKKIDVCDKGGYLVASAGARGYKDNPTYLKEEGKKYADERRKLYKIRHNKHRNIAGSPSFYADKLLW